MPDTARVHGATVTFPPPTACAAPCPACTGGPMRVFYEVAGIPVHSCLLMPTREAARAYSTGSLRLAHCEGCGFITNLDFDPADNEYGPEYEETQGFSPTFNAFSDGLTHRLAARHELAGRTVLEIGCGKGEFLVALCAHAGCRGIGIDPAWRADRLGDLPEGVEFIPELYDRRSAHLDADVIVCRHTLEHIAPVHAFLDELRRTIGSRRTVTLFFELPDVERVLAEGAFWDLYYEHCSYFSCGSLARAFRTAGFRVTDVELVYDNQYIILTAEPADGPVAPHAAEGDLGEVAASVDRFTTHGAAIQRRWRAFIDERVRSGRRVVLWGSGSKGVSFLTTLGLEEAIGHVVDINPHKHGRFMAGTGQPIIGPNDLVDLRPDTVIVMNPVYLDEINATLSELGLEPKVVAV